MNSAMYAYCEVLIHQTIVLTMKSTVCQHYKINKWERKMQNSISSETQECTKNNR